jgi:hypothetical protein
MSNRYSRQFTSDWSTNNWNTNNYNDVYSDSYNTKHSLSNESNVEYEENTHYVSVSSKDRDRSIYPSVSNYIIDLPNEFKNIYSIELIQAIIPAKNNADEEPYLLLNIGEISDVVLSNDKNISDSFAILQPNTPIKAGGFMQIDKRIHENTVKYYKTPKANLSRMTIKILDSLGDVFNFGTDTVPPNVFDKTLQNTFIFKIITLEKRRKELNHRNVF